MNSPNSNNHNTAIRPIVTPHSDYNYDQLPPTDPLVELDDSSRQTLDRLLQEHMRIMQVQDVKVHLKAEQQLFSQINSLQTRLNDITQLDNQLSKLQTDLTTKIQQLDNDLSTRLQSITDNKTHLDTQQMTLKHDMNEISQKIDLVNNIKTDINRTVKDTSTLQKSLHELRKEVVDLINKQEPVPSQYQSQEDNESKKSILIVLSVCLALLIIFSLVYFLFHSVTDQPDSSKEKQNSSQSTSNTTKEEIAKKGSPLPPAGASMNTLTSVDNLTVSDTMSSLLPIINNNEQVSYQLTSTADDTGYVLAFTLNSEQFPEQAFNDYALRFCQNNTRIDSNHYCQAVVNGLSCSDSAALSTDLQICLLEQQKLLENFVATLANQPLSTDE